MDNTMTLGASSPSAAGRMWESLRKGALPLDTAIGTLAAFALVLFQTAVLYWVLHRFKIENELFRLMIAAAFSAFAIHHFLPRRFQQPFFLVFSMLLIGYCLGLQRAVWTPMISLERAGPLFAIGAVLIGICRLPIAYGKRVLCLLAVAGLLGLFRVSILKWQALDAIWPVLGGMFMYRLSVFLYDYEHEKVKSSWLQACSYFFLFPNVWLFVFPVIDYKAFVKGYFNGQPALLYQRGLAWMMRGTIHLLVWRLIYYQIYVDPAKIASEGDLVLFLLSNVSLYLKVTGQFHFAIGLLHLFGYSLPETNHRFFLTTGFVDYWRRANIYMKDFLMKVSYYPLVVRFKKLGPTRSVVAAIGGTFVVTWFLHSYQWFWIRGDFPMSVKDTVFWALLGGGVIINSVMDMKRAKKPKPSTPWKPALSDSATAGFMFLLITTIWSVWTCDSLTQWLEIWKYAGWTLLAAAALSFSVIASLYLAIESAVSPWRKSAISNPASTSFPLKPVLVSCLLPAAFLIGGTTNQALSMMPVSKQEYIRCLFWNTPNKSGEEFLVRGYYEELMDAGRFNPALDDAMNAQPKDWVLLERTPAVKVTNDLRTRALHPGVKLVINGVPFETNRWSMRDQDYELAKPSGRTRLAFVGSSITMGWNVPKESTFEALFEKEINEQEGAGRLEALNFAVNGYSIVSLAEHMQAEVLRFRPDVAVVVSHPEDPPRAVFMLAKSIAAGYRPQDEAIRRIVEKAGVAASDPRNKIERQLAPFKMELTRWAYESMAATCNKNGIQPWLLFLPGVLQRSTGEIDHQLVDMAKTAGFQVIPLHDVYASETDRSQLAVAPWDAHPNVKGHRMVASSLLAWVREHGMLKFK